LEASKICSQDAGVNKTIHSQQSRYLCQALVSLRKAAGLTQRDLAKRLRRERSLIGRLELGERRLDMVEFYWICAACGADPLTEASKLMRQFQQLESGHATD
jgi:transcriptional regulator with XRE-family HTH domain